MPTESKSLEKKKKSQRKHFPKYITDIYSQGVWNHLIFIFLIIMESSKKSLYLFEV